ncbi:protein grindelwald [Scaptodrosophila lebanonensis]|uniref:Protein grindelwald n=1 Tax=Drosophila lebanonensis TaxID=7225 RepID=A0A6J2U6Z9_DROLE|nr:protein grindelwald [Scaptodrosophila lebanonensis]
MPPKEMRNLALSIGATLLPSFSLFKAADAKDCHGKVCRGDEYCSPFTENCVACASICDDASHNYQADTCAKECADYKKYEPLKAEIQNIQTTQNLILLLLIILLALVVIRYLLKFARWLRHTRCVPQLLKKLQPKQQRQQPNHVTANGKDLNATTIQNINAINRDIEREPSTMYSVAGAAEGSVLTMTTPVSTRYPAENSTTPTTLVTEYSYDNQAMVVTPVSEKPTVTTAAF